MTWKPERLWTPHQQVLMDGGRMGVRISVKRGCNGPHGDDGYLLGDTTDVELTGAVRRRQLNDVSGRCGLCRGFHVIFANPAVRPYDWRERDGDTWTLEMLCPGVPAGEKALPCATYEPCGCGAPDDDPLTEEFQAMLDRPCPTSPTGVHRHLMGAGFVGAPTGGCWYQRPERLTAAAGDLIQAPGMYPVNVAAVDDETAMFELADLSRRDTAPAPA